MKKNVFLLIALVLTALNSWAQPAENSGSEASNNTFWLGADISGATAMEAFGVQLYNAKGEPRECTALMKELGLNAVRLRVWVNPKDGFSSKEDVLKMALRAQALDMPVMIDFHYSDWWADPNKQNIPQAWKDFNYEQMKAALASHTRETLELLRQNHVDVKWVQVGNETTHGFLWPMGRAEENMQQYAGLTDAGYEAVKAVYPEAIVLVHLDCACDPARYDFIFDGLQKYGTRYDMIGVSVYPYWDMDSKLETSWEGTVKDFPANLRRISEKYGKPTMVVETGVEAKKPQEGKKIMAAIINAAKYESGACKGVFYWAPEAEGAYPLGAFDNHRPTAIMDAFTEASNPNSRDNCFGIIAGKNATADGSVLFAHNEDDGGEQMVNVYLTQPEPGIAQYFWCELPKQTNSDCFMNKYGVAVASDYSPSYEDRDDFTNGGTVYLVRQTIAQRARTAREGVHVAAEVVERLGYNGPGRTYLIADAQEAWMMSIVRGRRWVAQRCPDDKVMAIANNYVIDRVNLADTLNFLGSPDLVDYAIERGWYNPTKDGAFSFKRAYGRDDRYRADHNTLRHRSVLETLIGKPFSADPDTFPLDFTPKHKLTVQDMIDALSTHKSETDTCHNGLVCSNPTVVSTVFQLRTPTSTMPFEVANVMWLCIGHPCIEPYIPWYMGMTEVPEHFGRFDSYKEAQEKHFTDVEAFRQNYPNGHYWTVLDRFEALNRAWNTTAAAAIARNAKLQKQILNAQSGFEKSLQKLSGDRLAKKLNAYPLKWYKKQ